MNSTCPPREEARHESFKDQLGRYVDENWGHLGKWVCRITLNIDDAEDAMQNALIRALERSDSYDPERPLGGWLWGIVRNEARDIRRARWANIDPVDLDSILEATQAHTGNERLYMEAAKLLDRFSLPLRQLQAVWHRCVLKLPVGKVADRMGTSAGNVRVLVSKARPKLCAAGFSPDGSDIAESLDIDPERARQIGDLIDYLVSWKRRDDLKDGRA